jgi:hypothetical protein
MDNSGPKFWIAVVFMILAGFLFFFVVGYFQKKDQYLRGVEGHPVSRGKSRDTKLPFVVLSDGYKVYLGSWDGTERITLKDSDTLIKPQKSFKLYFKRKGEIRDSFRHMLDDDLSAKFVKYVH